MRNVFANGFPKSGNHALVKSLELLGIPSVVNHTPYSASASDVVRTQFDAGVFIKRDPRNVVVSMLRFAGRPVTPGTFITMLRCFQDRPLVQKLGEYEGWLHEPDVLVVRFEDLISNDLVMRSIASHLHIPYISNAFDHLPGLTRTWTGKHSDYRDVWTDEVDVVWRDEGGIQLLRCWDYE